MRVTTAVWFLATAMLLCPITVLGQGTAPDGVKVANGVLVDSKGMTLYTFDYDTQPNVSVCAGDCLVQWPALVAGADAKPMGDWTPISRTDGSKQWAYKDKPLYTYYEDKKPGDKLGDGNAQVWHAAAP